MQAIKAYYDDGKFIPCEPVKIPKGSHAIITILDFSIENMHEENDNDVSRRQIEAMRRFREEIRSNDEPVHSIPERLQAFDTLCDAIDAAAGEEMPPLEPIRFREVEIWHMR